jgi:hypothetical protein
MKRLEKSKMKEAKRAQRKLERAAQKQAGQSGPQIEITTAEEPPQN